MNTTNSVKEHKTKIIYHCCSMAYIKKQLGEIIPFGFPSLKINAGALYRYE